MSEAYFPSLKDIMTAEHTLNDILVPTPLMKNRNLSEKYAANILLKREDLQMVRSYKIRGAYHKIKSLTAAESERGIVCASAGNHAQGVAFSCSKLGIKGKIYMPVTTPKQKINQVKMFGGKSIEIVLTGDTFDQANKAAIEACEKEGMVFIPPFNDPRIIEGQATVGLEIIQEARMKIDYIFVPIGGGGLASGIGSFYKQMSPKTKIIGVEPAGALSISALDHYKDEIKDKNVVCVVSGSNNDITRMEEIKERSLLYEGQKHYFVVRFPQRAGALQNFVSKYSAPTTILPTSNTKRKPAGKKARPSLASKFNAPKILKVFKTGCKNKVLSMNTSTTTPIYLNFWWDNLPPPTISCVSQISYKFRFVTDLFCSRKFHDPNR